MKCKNVKCENEIKKNSTKFCSHKCQKEVQYSHWIDDWLCGKIDGTIGTHKPKPSKHIYKYLKEEIDCCEICGTSEWNGEALILEIDHIDGNRLNNKRDNLRMLCPNCHSQTPTFRNNKRN